MAAVTSLCALIFGLSSVAENYCDPSYCPAGEVNVGCNAAIAPAFGPECDGWSSVDVVFSDDNKNYLLGELNRYRQILASGNLPGFAAARKMPTLVWDDVLAWQARNRLALCFSSWKCLNTFQFRYVGIQEISRDLIVGSVNERIDDALQFLWSCHSDTSQSDLDMFNESSLIEARLFGQMVNDRAWKVGCAMIEYTFSGSVYSYLACLYSYGIFLDQPVYVKGQMASGCTVSPTASYNALCGIGEPIISAP